MKKTTVIDEDGNELAPPPDDSDVAHIIYLLEYGRKRGFRIGPTVQIGDVIVQVRDLRQEAQMHRDGQTPELSPDSDMGKLLLGDQ